MEEAKLAYQKELDQAKSEAAAILDKANARASQIVNDATQKQMLRQKSWPLPPPPLKTKPIKPERN